MMGATAWAPHPPTARPSPTTPIDTLPSLPEAESDSDEELDSSLDEDSSSDDSLDDDSDEDDSDSLDDSVDDDSLDDDDQRSCISIRRPQSPTVAVTVAAADVDLGPRQRHQGHRALLHVGDGEGVADLAEGQLLRGRKAVTGYGGCGAGREERCCGKECDTQRWVLHVLLSLISSNSWHCNAMLGLSGTAQRTLAFSGPGPSAWGAGVMLKLTSTHVSWLESSSTATKCTE